MRYEFVCPTCEMKDEVETSIHEDYEPPFCPECGYKLRRVYNAPAIQFKGGGFYSSRG